MHKAQFVLVVLMLPLLVGCTLFGETPTPLAWQPTSAPTAVSQEIRPTSTAPPLPSRTASPTATLTPTPTPSAPSPSPTPAITEQAISVEVPHAGQTVTNPIHIQGHATIYPFEGTFLARVYDSDERLIAEVPIMAQGEPGGPASFTAEVYYGGHPGAGRLAILELSPRDGSVVAVTSVALVLRGPPGGGLIEMPQPLEKVTLPIKLLARVARPDTDVSVTVRWQDGTQFAHEFHTLAGLDGRGLIIVPLDFVDNTHAQPSTQDGALMIHDLQGTLLAYQPVHILHPTDPRTMSTQVFWVKDGTVMPQPRQIPRTPGIGRASLELLLWGPVPQNPEGYTTALPLPADVLTYPGRGPEWGERVRLLDLRIVDRVAYADFSAELRAHAGGAEQVVLMRTQIEQTLLQFPTVDQVVITVEGQTGWLEP